MFDKSTVLEYKFFTDHLPDFSINNYLSYVSGQIPSLATSIREKNVIHGGISIKFNYAVNYYLHRDEDYQSLSLEEIFNKFYQLCQVRDIFGFVNWLNDAEGEQIEEDKLISILNKDDIFTEEMAKLIIKRIEEHIKIKTALKRALYSHTSVGVKKGFEDDEFTGVIKIDNYDKDSACLILELRKITDKILYAGESLKYQNLSFNFVFTFQYKIKKNG